MSRSASEPYMRYLLIRESGWRFGCVSFLEDWVSLRSVEVFSFFIVVDFYFFVVVVFFVVIFFCVPLLKWVFTWLIISTELKTLEWWIARLKIYG